MGVDGEVVVMADSVRVRRWAGASDERLVDVAVVVAETLAMLELVMLAFFVAFWAASFWRGSFMRLAAELDDARPDSEAVVEREAWRC